jgi:hypothetical protein
LALWKASNPGGEGLVRYDGSPAHFAGLKRAALR